MKLKEMFNEDLAMGPQAYSPKEIPPHVDPTELEDPDMWLAFTPEEAEYLKHAVDEYKTSASDPVKQSVTQKIEFVLKGH